MWFRNGENRTFSLAMPPGGSSAQPSQVCSSPAGLLAGSSRTKAARTTSARAARPSRARPLRAGGPAAALIRSRDTFTDKRPYYDGPAQGPFMHHTLTVVLQILL